MEIANICLISRHYIKNNPASGKNELNSSVYRVLGRVHLFQVSDAGIYCRSITELNTFNALHKITNSNHAIKFWIPPEDESVGAIIEIDGCRKKILLLFRSGNNNALSYNPDLYVPFVVDNSVLVTEQILYTLVR